MSRDTPIRTVSIVKAGSAGRRERRSAETRRRLFRCALRLVTERGLPNVTIEDITEAADVGKGTFFNYFESKNDVLAAMVEVDLGKVREALELAKAGRRSIQTVLRHFFAQSAEEHSRSPELARAFISSFIGSDTLRKHLNHRVADECRLVAQIVEIGQQRGEIDPRLKKEKVACLLQQAFLGTLLLWSLRGVPNVQSSMSAAFRHCWRSITASSGD